MRGVRRGLWVLLPLLVAVWACGTGARSEAATKVRLSFMTNL